MPEKKACDKNHGINMEMTCQNQNCQSQIHFFFCYGTIHLPPPPIVFGIGVTKFCLGPRTREQQRKLRWLLWASPGWTLRQFTSRLRKGSAKRVPSALWADFRLNSSSRLPELWSLQQTMKTSRRASPRRPPRLHSTGLARGHLRENRGRCTCKTPHQCARQLTHHGAPVLYRRPSRIGCSTLPGEASPPSGRP